MFNVHSKPGTVIDFVSNPELPEEAYVVPFQDEYGTIRNTIAYRPRSNKSPLDGLHFDEATDGLRARLNLGVPLKEVPPLDINGDPLNLLNKARHFVDSTIVEYDKLVKESKVSDTVETVVEPS